MKRLLSFLAVLQVVTVTSVSVVACETSSISLESVLTKPNLGYIIVGNVNIIPSDNTVKNAIKAINSMVDINAIELDNKTLTSATVKSKGNFYQGKDIIITFNLIVTRNLENDIQLPDLGNIGVDNPMEIPSEQLLKEYIVHRNSDAIIQGFTIKNITLIGATLVPNNNIYAGENLDIDFTLVIKGATDLSSVLTNHDFFLGYIGNNTLPSEDEIIENTIINNPALTEDDIYIDNISFAGATVVGQGKYTGTVDITYNFSSFMVNAFQIPNSEHITTLITDENDVFIGTVSGTVYISINGTTAFHAIEDFGVEISSMTINLDRTIYVGTVDGKVYQSQGTLHNFILIPGIATEPIIKLISQNDDAVFAIVPNKNTFYVSENNNPFYLFSETLSPSEIIVNLVMFTANRSVYVLTQQDKLYRSTDINPFVLIDSEITNIEKFENSFCFSKLNGDIYLTNLEFNIFLNIGNVPNTDILTMTVDKDRADIYIGTAIHDIYKSKNLTKLKRMGSYDNSLHSDVPLIYGAVASDGTFYAVGPNNSLYCSEI